MPIRVWEDQHKGQNVRAVGPIHAGTVVGPLEVQRVVAQPGMHTLQLAEHEHGDGLGTFAFLNHCCEPNVFVDTQARHVVALRDITDGEELGYFYPSTEWRLAVPFDCGCGTPSCVGRLAGTADLPPSTVLRYRLNAHILRLLGA